MIEHVIEDEIVHDNGGASGDERVSDDEGLSDEGFSDE